MKELNNRAVFEPIAIEQLILEEKRHAIESLIFLTPKRDETTKARAYANGKYTTSI